MNYDVYYYVRIFIVILTRINAIYFYFEGSCATKCTFIVINAILRFIKLKNTPPDAFLKTNIPYLLTLRPHAGEVPEQLIQRGNTA